MEYVFGEAWRLENKLGNGSFGEIFVGRHIETNEESAVKLEPVASRTNQLLKESEILKRLEGVPGIPRVYWYGTAHGFNALVIQLLGPSLDELFGVCQRQFTLKSVLMLAEQVLARIQSIHSHGILHRDIKAENFLIGLARHAKLVHLIDFGLAKKFKNKNGHIGYKENLGFTGNQKFCSINALLGYQQSRRDDLESIGYLLVYFGKGSLPWDSIKSTTKSAKREFITNMKIHTPIESLCDGLPPAFVTYMQYVRSLKFEAKPDYWYLSKLFKDALACLNCVYDWHFDWCSHRLYLNAAREQVIRPRTHFQQVLLHAPPSAPAPAPQDESCKVF